MHVVATRRAIGLILAGKADLVETGDGELRSATTVFPVPLVIRLRYFVKLPFASKAPLNKHTLTSRDNGECQVAGCHARGTTVDHVVPQARGGKREWENLVLMCPAHNQAKADKTLQELRWRLKKTPKTPKSTYLVAATTAHKHQTNEAWLPYLGECYAA